MQLNDLTDDVLALVLKSVLPCARGRVHTFKHGLSLLSICRKWRWLATPMVYGSAYLQYGTQITNVYVDGASNVSAHCEPENSEMESNMDLIATLGYAHMARQVAIEVFYVADPFPGFGAVIERMRMATATWSGVRTLELAMSPGLFPFDERNISLADSEGAIDETSSALAATMPGIRDLRFGGMKHNLVARALYSQLAEFYTEQLEVLHSRHAITVPQCRPFARLKDVSISGDNNHDNQLPRMCPDSIERLKLYGLVAGHSWAAFSAQCDGGAVTFPKLRNMHILYDAGDSTNGVSAHCVHQRPMVLQFPVLTNMAIRCSGNVCPLLEYAKLPPSMQSVSIAASPAVYQSIAAISLHATESLVLCVTGQCDGSTNTLATIDHILAKAGRCMEKELSVETWTLPVLPEEVTCLDLTRLAVRAPTSVDTMLGLIRKLASLDCLTLYDLTLGDIQADISIPEHGSVSPLNSSLGKIAVYFKPQQYPADQAIQVAKYLLLTLPALTEFLAMQIPKQPLVEFVAKYSQQYLHLANIRKVLCTQKDNSCFLA